MLAGGSDRAIELYLPGDWRLFRLPPALHERLQELLDKQDQQGKLTGGERREATALTQRVDILSVFRVRLRLARNNATAGATP